MCAETRIVDERENKTRTEIIEFLEELGYEIAHDEFRSKEEIINSPFPLVVDKSKQQYWMLGNITCAAAAASGGKMIKKEVFYDWVKL